MSGVYTVLHLYISKLHFSLFYLSDVNFITICEFGINVFVYDHLLFCLVCTWNTHRQVFATFWPIVLSLQNNRRTSLLVAWVACLLRSTHCFGVPWHIICPFFLMVVRPVTICSNLELLKGIPTSPMLELQKQ